MSFSFFYFFKSSALNNNKKGSFEESLLQRRFEPKFLVPGYKVLLGASGCYCTNQITIPAYTFFYELSGDTLTTPYVVSGEINLMWLKMMQTQLNRNNDL